MPTCENCGSDVSRRYMRVFAPDADGDPDSCPKCDLGLGNGAVESSGSSGVDWKRGDGGG